MVFIQFRTIISLMVKHLSAVEQWLNSAIDHDLVGVWLDGLVGWGMSEWFDGMDGWGGAWIGRYRMVG